MRHARRSALLAAIGVGLLVLQAPAWAGGPPRAGRAGSAGASHLTNKTPSRARPERSVRTARVGPGHVLLALGDSLAAGYQPTDGTSPAPVDPATGYADRGYPGSYAADVAAARHLRLVDLACPGETTASMLAAPARAACASAYSGALHARSQEQAALDYLARHRSTVALVTLDIGANDLTSCVVGASHSISFGCFLPAEGTITTNLGRILRPLRAALRRDDPRATIAAMDYYDPFLGLAVDPGGAAGSREADASLLAVNTLDAELYVLYRHAGVKVVDVSRAFGTDRRLPRERLRGRLVPADVARVCTLTWMCPAPGSRLGPDIHPTTAGYRLIARAFEHALGLPGAP